MTRVLPRTHFHSSKLIRCLTDLSMVEPVDHGDAFAEKLGLWVHFADAITLSAVHNSGLPNLPTMQPEARGAARAAAAAEFDRVQSLLASSIKASCGLSPGKARVQLPEPQLALPMDAGAAYAPYGWFYAAHQRDMESNIQPMRTQVRATLAKVSPGRRKLAELDATLERIVRERESKLLSKMPALLKQRFEQSFRAHQQKMANTGQADDPAGWTRAGGWLARFYSEMQTLLLAELELRLQPAMGLIDAFDNKIGNE